MDCSSKNFLQEKNFKVKPLAFAILLAVSSSAKAATFSVTSVADSGGGSLREAIGFANAAAGADNIIFDPLLTGQTIFLTGSVLISQQVLTITGPTAGDASSITINGTGNSRVLRANDDLTVENMTLTGGAAVNPYAGGALYGDSSNLILNDVLVTGNTSVNSGGGVATSFGNITLNRSTVSNNSVTGLINNNGGGISATNGNVILNDSTVSGNSTAGDNGDGGGIFSSYSVSLFNSTVSSNTTSGANSEGGGIFSQRNITLNDSTVSNNSTSGSGSEGGGIFTRANAVLNNSVVSGNSTTGGGAEGGGIYADNDVTLNDSIVSNNTTSGSGSEGGGIYSDGGDVILNSSTVSGNSTSGSASEGGGIFAYYDAILNNSTVSGNSTSGSGSEGGGIFVYYNDAVLNNSTVSGNSTSGANSHGGGIYVYDDNVILTNSTVTGNRVTGLNSRGSGVYSDRRITLVNSILSGNSGGIAGNAFARSGIFSTNSIFADGPGELTLNVLNVFTNNPVLGPLQNNGGPTETHLPLAASPAVDAGDNAGAPANDQRGAGFPRIFNGTIDIGAVERQAVNPFQPAPAPVPIFSLTGLLAMISAFLGFGWRQRFLSRKNKE